MFKLKLICLLFLVTHFNASVFCVEFPGLQAIVNFFSGSKKRISEMSLEELGISTGKCSYQFLEYISYADKNRCELDEESILHLLNEPLAEDVKKPPIMIKCLQPDAVSNATQAQPTVIIMNSIQDFLNLLKPIGNATKRHEHGSCVLVFFYADDSVPCANEAGTVNMLPLQFPTLRIAAIDAMKFKSFNTEYGILGLPTLLLYHQGRPIVKYYTEISYAAFITRHTGIKATEPTPQQLSLLVGPLPMEAVERRNYVLWLAWSFIWTVLVYYFINSAWCKQIIEMIKRNWRESEAQLEH